MRNKNKSLIIFILVILLLSSIVLNFLLVSKYDFFTFYICIVIVPSILYSALCVVSFRGILQNRLIYYFVATVIHLISNVLLVNTMLTQSVFDQIVSNTMKVNPSIGENVSLDLSISSFVMTSFFVLILMVIENYCLRKWRRVNDTK